MLIKVKLLNKLTKIFGSFTFSMYLCIVKTKKERMEKRVNLYKISIKNSGNYNVAAISMSEAITIILSVIGTSREQEINNIERIGEVYVQG